MKCRYCADNLQVINDKLVSKIGEKCGGNPKGFHVAVSNGDNCVYCGNPVTSKLGKPFTKYGNNCKNSPTGLHCLQ